MLKPTTTKWLLRGLALFMLLALAVLGAAKAPAVLAQASQQSNADVRLAVDGSGVMSLEAGRLAEAELANMPEVYSSPLVISAADFRDDGYAPEGMAFWFALGRIEGDSTLPGACIMAPAYLPNGASLYQMWSSVKDNSTSDMWARLYRVHVGTGVVDIMAEINTTGVQQPSLVQPYDMSITNPVVAYPEYSYYIGSCLQHEDIELYSIRLWYTE